MRNEDEQLTLELDGEALRDAAAQAMLGVLTPEVKSRIIEDAVQSILKPGTNSWDRGESPLDRAFERAIEKVAEDDAARMVAEDSELRESIQGLLRTVADKVLNADVDKMTERMASAFVNSMRQD